MSTLLDSYNRKAQLYPGFLTLFPVFLSLVAWFPVNLQWIATAGSLVVTFGVAMLIERVVRKIGKSKEERLFSLWGGMPSVKMLSYAHSSLNRKTLRRCHEIIIKLAPSLKIPNDLAEETANSTDALFAYESASDLLRSKTRDKKKFNLVFEEVVNYGFWRNMWGLKPFGILFSMIGIAVSTSRIIQQHYTSSDVALAPIVCAAASLIWLLVWWAFVSTESVHEAAQTYAKRLVEACDQIEP